MDTYEYDVRFRYFSLVSNYHEVGTATSVEKQNIWWQLTFYYKIIHIKLIFKWYKILMLFSRWAVHLSVQESQFCTWQLNAVHVGFVNEHAKLSGEIFFLVFTHFMFSLHSANIYTFHSNCPWKGIQTYMKWCLLHRQFRLKSRAATTRTGTSSWINGTPKSCILRYDCMRLPCPILMLVMARKSVCGGCRINGLCDFHTSTAGNLLILYYMYTGDTGECRKHLWSISCKFSHSNM